MPEADQVENAKVIESSGENLSKGLTNLNEPGLRNKLSLEVKKDLDSYTQWLYDDGFRWHLGASKIGEECKRSLWYGFRWVQPQMHDGRMQRLFNRGHKEESRHAEWLRGIGFTLWTHDESITKEDGTHPQLRIRNKCKGHLGGSLDGIVKFPDRYGIDTPAILESKTSGTGKGFNDLSKLGMAKAKQQHYIQNSIYGYDYGIEDALYICANKNDDDLYVEVVKLDFKLAQNMEVKAESIIFSQTPPARISENPTYFQCKNLCDFSNVCFHGKPAVKNCRSCVNCSAVDAGEFYCSLNNGIIPRDFVPIGCDGWISITVAAAEQADKNVFVFNTKEEFEASKNVGIFEIESDIAIPK